ncbi:hypothetical protein C8R43DRAFT_1017019 [Mycena crocata]|nr:hypothetical protein C8R43DRAFT_1017019 [Mycena crocata]
MAPRHTVAGFSSHILPVFKSLTEPATSPFCHYTYMHAMGECQNHIASAHSADPTLQKIIKYLITFYTKDMVDIALYQAFEERLFRRPCRCVVIYPSLQDFHQFVGSATMTVGTRCSAREEVVDLPSFVDILSELADRLIAATQGEENAGVRAWRRRISNFVDENSFVLIRSFTHWLQRTNKVYVFALFGTLVELSFKVTEVTEASEEVKLAFEKRLHALLETESTPPSKPTNHSTTIYSTLDLVFHGAGCLAYAVSQTMFSASSKDRLHACFSSGAQKWYDNVCRLLSLLPKADKGIQDGTVHDKFRLAHFGAKLHTLLPRECGLLSPLITSVINNMPRTPAGWQLFSAYFAAIDRCSNPAYHSPSAQHDSQRDSFAVQINTRVKRGDRINACASCKASRFCSKECQKESWKGGKYPHRSVCPVLAKIHQVHDSSRHTIGRLERMESRYSDAAISTAEVEVALGYVVAMLQGFSDYVD